MCDLIRKDLENEEMKIIAADLEEIKHKLDILQESVKSGVIVSPTPTTEVEDETEEEDLSMTLEFL